MPSITWIWLVTKFPTEFKLGVSYPNPFNPVTNFQVEIAQASEIEIDIYDIRGRKIDNIFTGYLPRGIYDMSWNASSFSSGIYFISMHFDYKLLTQKVTLVK